MALNRPNKNEQALIQACKDSDWQTIYNLVRQEDVSVNTTDENQRTPLMWAVISGDPDLVDDMELVINCLDDAKNPKLDLEARDKEGNTALSLAIKAKRWKGVEKLIQLGADINAIDVNQRTPLMRVIIDKWFTGIKILLQAKENLKFNAQDIDGNTALMLLIKAWIEEYERALLTTSSFYNFSAKSRQYQREIEALIDLDISTLHIKNLEGATPLSLLQSMPSFFEDRLRQYMPNDDIKPKKVTYAEDKDKYTAIVKEAGHILGFTTGIAFRDTSYLSALTFYMKPTGMMIPVNCLLLKKYLHTFPKELHDARLEHVLNLVIEFYNQKCEFDKLKQYYLDGNCIILPIQFSLRDDKKDVEEDDEHKSHSITIVASHDILIVCNRGAASNSLLNHISVFKVQINNTANFLQTIMYQSRAKSLYSSEMYRQIYSLVGLDGIFHPLLYFPSIEQQYGTCSFVNLKSSLLPILFFMKLLQREDSAREVAQFNYELLEPYLKGHPKHNQLKKMMDDARKVYKTFTKAIRDEKVHELCEDFKKLSDAVARRIYMDIFSAILDQHHGQEKNRSRRNRPRENRIADLKRVIKIVSLLPLMTPGEKKEILPHINNALKQAIELKQPDIVKLFVQQLGIDFNIKSNDGTTAILLLAESSRWDIVRLLLQQDRVNVDILNIPDSEGTTVLHYAVLDGKLDVLQLLLQKPGIHLNAKDNENNTALLLAVKYLKWDCVKCLLQQSNVELTLQMKENILNSAQAANQTEVVDLIHADRGSSLSIHFRKS